MVSRYMNMSNGTVKQEGICLLPQPHYRMLAPPQRPDYPVSTPPGGYVPPPPNQGGNQGPNMRGPSGPPNQSSTPPNAGDIKVPTLPQQPSISPMFVSQVRPNYYTRTGPPSQPPRMANHNSRPQAPLFTPAQPQYMHVAAPQVYLTSTNSVPYTYGTQQRPTASFVPQVPVYQHIYSPYGTTPAQTPPVSYNYFQPQMMQRSGSIPQATAANPNTTQTAMPNVPLVSSNHNPSFQRQPPNKRRANALAIIDPNTGADRLQEMFEDSSHPPSGESSARQTPQPSSVAHSHIKEVQATFAKQVLQVLNTDTAPEHIQQHHHHHVPTHPQEDHHSELQPEVQQTNHIVVEFDSAGPQRQGGGPGQQVQQQQQHQLKMDHVVQSSKLTAEAKEFVLPPTTAKETPIVSANIDAVEVTLLPNKLPKDRESPVKGRKQREQLSRIGDHNKEVTAVVEKAPPVSIAPSKEPISDTESSITKDEVKSIPDIPSPSVIQATNPTPVPLVTKDSVVVTKDISSGGDKHQPQHRPPPSQQQQQQQRKDAKEPPAKAALERQDSGSSVGSAQSGSSQDNAKSKQNAQRSASKQGSGGPNNNQKGSPPPSVVVPQPQPAKPASKSNKKNELNLKGANKEGTDMDAFNDNAQSEEVNSNVIPSETVNNNDIINANSIPPTTNSNATPPQVPLVRDVNVNIETNNIKFENEMTIKPPEPVTKPIRNKIDITDIVREKPKNIKPYNSMIEGQDETDRAAVAQSNEKMVQAKNDVNAKTSEISRIENKLPYTDGQWSPANQSGIKKYQKDFLMALRDIPASRVAPDNIPDSVLAEEKGRLSDGRLSMGGSRTDFNPSFNTYGRNSSQKGPLPSRLSGSKMDRGKGNKGSNVKPTMKVSISVREEVKLHEAENAWRPARLHRSEFPTDDEKKTADLYKKVRGILNKLTPQKFDLLLQQIRSLLIDTSDRLQGVIDLVFEKAVDEPNFSVAYANMCSQLALLQVPAGSEDKQEFVNFRKLLITRCQVEFEKQSVDESIRNTKMKEIEVCSDPEKRKDLEFDLEDYDRKLRMKSVGNIRFIGELFKQNMLTVNIMMRCLNNLLENKDEESLECLCKLLTTIGKELESKSVSLAPIFGQMKSFADKKDTNSKISSRIRFMLQDVIDLRNSKWVPRRQDLNPKMIDQIQKEAEQEQMNIQLMNSGPMTPRKDDRGGGGSGGQGGGSMSDRKGGRSRNVTDDGWGMVPVNNRGKSSFSVQSDKLKAGRAPLSDEPLGTPSMFKQWHKGSGANVKPVTPQVPNTTNMYAALENIEGDRRTNSRHGQKDSYHSKGASLERGGYKYDSRGGSRSGSQHRSNDNSASYSQRGTPGPTSLPPQVAASRPQPPQVPVAAAPTPVTTIASAPEVPELTDDQRFRRILNSLDEYVSGNCSVDEYFIDISCSVPVTYFSRMVNDSYLHILEKSQQMRLKTGGLFAKLVVQGKIPLEDYCVGLEDLLSQADDLKIDIPKIWDYLAEILVDLISEDAVPLKRLHKTFGILIEQMQADRLLAPLFKSVISNKGPHFLHSQWQLSGLQLSDFMDSSRVESFVRDNQFEFLLSGAAPVGHNQLSYEEIQSKMLNFLKTGRNIDDIHNWVMANIGESGAQENKFIRALATAIFEDSINKHHKLNPDRLEQHNQLLHKYVDNKPGFELECLYALQALIHKMEHPQGLLLLICDKLYELGTFSEESFVAWEQSQDPAEQEGKGVALKQLTSFFCQLKENDDDDSSGSDQDIED